MAAFDRIKSGIPGLDKALDNIRLGDNVVWNVTNLNEFSYFADPYIKQAKEPGLFIYNTKPPGFTERFMISLSQQTNQHKYFKSEFSI